MRDIFQAFADKIYRKSHAVGTNPKAQSRYDLVENMVHVNLECLCSPSGAQVAFSEARCDGKVLVFIQDIPRLLGREWRILKMQSWVCILRP